jgi:hypothetical protein
MPKDNDFFEQKTRVIRPSDTEGDARSPGDNATRVLNSSAPTATPSPAQNTPPAPPSAATRVWQPGGTAPEEKSETIDPGMTTSAPASADVGFVIGWIVITHGPGRGKSFPLGYGWNSIGREDSQDVCLSFGDEQISRENHCAITYDGKNRAYYIQHGGGRNITYLNDSPVLAPTEIEDEAVIALGDTILKLVKFCTASFDWQDHP